MKNYAQAGVDIAKVQRMHAFINRLIASTKNRETLPIYGHYAGLLKVGGSKLAIHADGVGTKVLIAQNQEKYDTIGIDAVAMNANDIICVGARPVALVDYIALEREDEALMRELLKGIVKGARECGAAVVGGETAIMGDVIRGLPGRTGFDLAATMLGIVEGDVLTGKKIRPGDAVIGLASSGIHSNGLTLARKVLDLGSWGAELLKPTKIYAKPAMKMLKEARVRAMAHVTGGAFGKLARIAKPGGVGIVLDSMPEPPEIFREIQKATGAGDADMYKTFNMGIGLCVVVPEKDAGKAIEISKKSGVKARKIGSAVKGSRIVLIKNREKIALA